MAGVISALNSLSTMLFGGDVLINGVSTHINGSIPTFFNWVTSAEVLPFFALGIVTSLVLLSARIVRSIFWGV